MYISILRVSSETDREYDCDQVRNYISPQWVSSYNLVFCQKYNSIYSIVSVQSIIVIIDDPNNVQHISTLHHHLCSSEFFLGHKNSEQQKMKAKTICFSSPINLSIPIEQSDEEKAQFDKLTAKLLGTVWIWKNAWFMLTQTNNFHALSHIYQASKKQQSMSVAMSTVYCGIQLKNCPTRALPASATSKPPPICTPCAMILTHWVVSCSLTSIRWSLFRSLTFIAYPNCICLKIFVPLAFKMRSTFGELVSVIASISIINAESRWYLPGIVLPGSISPEKGTNYGGHQPYAREWASKFWRRIPKYLLWATTQETVGFNGKAKQGGGRILFFFQVDDIIIVSNLTNQFICGKNTSHCFRSIHLPLDNCTFIEYGWGLPRKERVESYLGIIWWTY